MATPTAVGIQEETGAYPVIELQDVTKVYQMGQVTVNALGGISMHIDQGEWVAIMGPSGSGKSTLMNILGCLDSATGGIYLLDQIDVRKLNDDKLAEIRNQKVGFVFQAYNLLARTSAVDNVAMPLRYCKSANCRDRAKAALVRVGLSDRLHHRPNQLSGGEQQRVAIARALVNDPALILADEPTGNLDSKSGKEIMTLLVSLHEQGMTIVTVTHDANIAGYAQRVVHLQDGLIEREEIN